MLEKSPSLKAREKKETVETAPSQAAKSGNCAAKLRQLLLPLAGFGSLLWFLIRVIPKPSRANYPCMRAAAPLASSFVISLLGFFSSIALFRKAKGFLKESRLVLFTAFLAASLGLGFLASIPQAVPVAAYTTQKDLESPGQVLGKGLGIFPGRVVWVHDSKATDDGGIMDFWYEDARTDQAVVDRMLVQGLQDLTGTQDALSAWNALFENFNQSHGRQDQAYTPGEKIVIKINLNGLSQGRKNINTSPQVCHSLLRQLVEVLGVAQEDIFLGDPNINLDKKMYSRLFKDFPRVNYWGKGEGYVKPVGSRKNVLFASDGGTQDPLPQAYLDAAYIINIPVLKKHHRAGISLAAKNHFGSITPYNGNGAFAWHYSLPVPDGGGDNSNGKYGQYRCLVDFMGHKDLGGKTLLYLLDGLWGSINWGHPAIKWRMAPFNNDWPSSLFLSQDPVAIESVGFDFLYEEFGTDNPQEGSYDPRDTHGPFPHYAGVDDYLRQAADSSQWPVGFVYDPERDGTPLPDSLGVHEHWNNALDKQYSRNLGKPEGIELRLLENS